MSTPTPAFQSELVDAERRQWFAQFAKDEIMPRLQQAAEAARRDGATASCRLGIEDGKLAAELVIVPPGLPAGMRPPQLTVYPVEGERPLEVEYTGTFPHAGVTGGFAGEIDYDAIYPDQLDEKIVDFLALATG